MRAQMNLNDYVTVHLNELGIEMLHRAHNAWEFKLKRSMKGYVMEPFVEPENGMLTVQMWELFQIFGDCTKPGEENAFNMNVSLHKVQVAIEEEKR